MSDDNPYQSTLPPPQEELKTGNVLRASTLGRSFFLVAFLALIVLIVLTFLTHGALVWTIPIYALGLLRTWLVHRRRAIKQLRELNAIRLLVSSTLLTSAILVSCSVAFLGICYSGAMVIGPREVGLIAWLSLNSVVAITAFAFLFVRSIGWAASVP